MGFADSRGSHEDDVIFLIYKGQIQEVEDLDFVDCFWEREVEGIDGFDSWEAGLKDAYSKN